MRGQSRELISWGQSNRLLRRSIGLSRKVSEGRHSGCRSSIFNGNSKAYANKCALLFPLKMLPLQPE